MTEIIRVVLVDDHALVRVGIKGFLERADNIRVVGEAGDGIEAQAIIDEQHPHVVLVDIEMPKLGGVELAAWIRERCAEVKIMMLSSYDDDAYIMAALQAGANGYALKNTSPEKLVQAVEAVHSGQSSLDPAIATKVMGLLTGGAKEEVVDTDLSDRELQVLEFVAQGRTNKEIGRSLCISGRTVQGHLSKIFAKLGVESRTEAVVKAGSLGLIKINYEK